VILRNRDNDRDRCSHLINRCDAIAILLLRPAFGMTAGPCRTKQPLGLNATRMHAVGFLTDSSAALPDTLRTSNSRLTDRHTGVLMPPSVDGWLPRATFGPVRRGGDRMARLARDDWQIPQFGRGFLPSATADRHHRPWLCRGGRIRPDTGSVSTSGTTPARCGLCGCRGVAEDRRSLTAATPRHPHRNHAAADSGLWLK
jgi:hypothetical protein